jgi:hypothetical protein
MLREPAHHSQHEHHFSDHTIAACGMFCREAMLVYFEGSSEMIGGANKTFGSTREISVGQNTIGDTLLGFSWCFNDVKLEFGRTLLFPYWREPPTYW